MARSKETNLPGEILRLLREPKYRPLDKIEIADSLGYPAARRNEVRRALQDLEQAGEIARIRKNRYVLPDSADLVTGTLSVHEGGYAFLTSEKPGQADLFIAAENTATAMHGDRVVARIIRPVELSRARRPRAEGRVIRILARANDTAVGTLQQTRNFFYVVPDDPRLIHNIYVQPRRVDGRLPNPGDKVVVRLERWESRHVNPEGNIIEVLGPRTAPGVDILSIIRKYHLPLEFPAAVVAEADEIPADVSAKGNREDLRDQFILTIDPDDARDFDDAIHVEEVNGGGWRLGVHIADVSAYVRPGSALDREARRRGNSVYLPDRVIPMLPERLSNGVCSLNPHVDRLTASVFMTFDRNGRPRSARFGRSMIRSARRLTYREAFALLKSPGGSDEATRRLHVAWKLASILRKNRFRHGSLDLDMPEVKVVVDKKGKPIRFERVENDESHQLIEEFMLAANDAVARELKNRGIPAIYRVHENPEPEKLAEFREFALAHGIRIGDLTHRNEVQRLLEMMRGKAEEHALKIGLLKSLKRARYATAPLGHYGLAKANYAHFTSPIRRYADLTVHRALLDGNGKKNLPIGQLSAIADHISVTERNAAEAEMDAVKMKKLEFFEGQLHARDPQIFDAMVIDVRNYGLLIELPDILLTGLVHVSTLSDDFYVFSPAEHQFIGRQSRRRFAVGDRLRVHVARVDRFKRQIDFALSDLRSGVPSERKRRR